MPLLETREDVHARDALSPRRGAAVVVVPVHNALDDVERCLASIAAHTADDVALLVIDDASTDPAAETRLRSATKQVVDARSVVLLSNVTNMGFVATMNRAFGITAPADVVVMNSDVEVGPQWLERLRDAAYSATTIASATCLTNSGTIVSVPDRNRPRPDLPDAMTIDEAARRVAAGAARMRPRLPTVIGHCAYLRRSALELVGSFDEAFAPGYGEEVDWSQRCIRIGLEHVLADDVLVLHKGAASFGTAADKHALKEKHEREVERRYPYYRPWVHDEALDETTPLAAALLAARCSLLGFDIAVDGLCLRPLETGTQVGVIELVRALARHPDVRRLRLHVPKVVGEYVEAALDGVGVERVVDALDTPPPHEPADVMIRPYQVREADELRWLKARGRRLVVNQLDLIAYANPTYSRSYHAWRAYRRLQRQTLVAADAIAFLSEHGRQQADDAGLVPAGVPQAVLGNGVDHARPEAVAAARPPDAAGVANGFLLVLGVAYQHKNRLFALEMLEQLAARGWDGQLVLAGAVPAYGASDDAENVWLAAHRDLAPRVVRIGAVSGAQKEWVFEHAGLVLYPTLAEGFGLIPFEAAAYGRACLSTRAGGLDEVLPRAIPTIDPGDPARAADDALRLLRDSAAADAVVREITAAGERFTWAAVADGFVRLAREASARPRSAYDVAASTGPAGAQLRAVVRYVADHPRLRAVLPADTRRGELARRVGRRLRG